MPMITVPLAVSYDNITRRIAQSVSRDVMVLCDIDPDTPVYVVGEFTNTAQPGGVDQEDNVQFDSYERIEVTADDQIRRSSAMSMNLMSNEEPPVFEDRRLGISVRPIYFESDLTLNIKYTADTRQAAMKWNSEMALRFAQQRGSLYHEVVYDAPVHDGLLGLLAHFYELREKVAGYGDTFPEYFNLIKQREIAALGAQDGDIDKVITVIPEKQVGITGYFDFDGLPQERKVDNNVTWEIEFQYKLQYKRWTHYYISYPMMIHQQWISRKYFSSKPSYGLEELPKTGSIGVRAFDGMDGYMDYFPPPVDGVRFPAFDEWIPPRNQQPPYSIPGITWLIQLDPKDPQDLLNLTQIPDVRFTKEMDTYLRLRYATLHQRGGAACFLTLYCDDLAMAETMLTIDKDLNVRATRPLDLRHQYHLRLSFATYYSVFSRDAIRSMEDNAIAALQIFQTILPTLDVEDALSRFIDDRYMPVKYIEWFYRYLQTHGIGFENESGVRDVNTGEVDFPPDPYGPGSGGNQGTGGAGGGPSGPGSGAGSGGSGSGRPNNGSSGGRYVQFLSIVAMRKTTDKPDS